MIGCTSNSSDKRSAIVSTPTQIQYILNMTSQFNFLPSHSWDRNLLIYDSNNNYYYINNISYDYFNILYLGDNETSSILIEVMTTCLDSLELGSIITINFQDSKYQIEVKFDKEKYLDVQLVNFNKIHIHIYKYDLEYLTHVL